MTEVENEKIGIEGMGLMILRLLGVLVGTSWACAYVPSSIEVFGSLAPSLMLSVIYGHAFWM